MGEGRIVRDFGIDRLKTEATLGAYEVQQSPTGKAAVFDKENPVSSGTYVELSTVGSYTLPKTSGFVGLKGGRAWWDHSANRVHYKKVHDRDFYVGRFAEGAPSLQEHCVIDLNADPPYDIDLCRDAFLSTLVGTPAAGGFGYPVTLGGARILELSGTSEAQKVDLLSVEGFSKGANAIVEFAYRVLSDGAGTAPDFNIGIANSTHASDADSITEHMLLHLDGNATDIKLQSKDGVASPVTATDTTVDYTEGGDLAKRVEGWMDVSAEGDVQCYVNGSLVLDGTTFTLAGAASTLFLLAHLEKSSAADVYKIALDWFRVRFAEQ